MTKLHMNTVLKELEEGKDFYGALEVETNKNTLRISLKDNLVRIYENGELFDIKEFATFKELKEIIKSLRVRILRHSFYSKSEC